MIDKNGEVVMDNPEWYAIARFSDDSEIERVYQYSERTYQAENRRQAEIEAQILSIANKYARALGVEVTFYSVGVREHADT